VWALALLVTAGCDQGRQQSTFDAAIYADDVSLGCESGLDFDPPCFLEPCLPGIDCDAATLKTPPNEHPSREASADAPSEDANAQRGEASCSAPDCQLIRGDASDDSPADAADEGLTTD
jgi:hypothetical protein